MSKIPIHPKSVELLRKKHPWITRDSFSEKFPQSKFLLDIIDPDSGESFGQFVHDHQHPKIKARFWSKKEVSFDNDLEKRLQVALAKRSIYMEKRDNIYLCFGEADFLPGLFIQKLGSTLFIQYNAFFWEKKLSMICDFFKSTGEFNNIWIDKNVSEEKNITIREGDIKLKLKFGGNSGIGIYTDMSAIREQLADLFNRDGNMLNLFSYTGAFSLMGLFRQQKVTSVDLSRRYMNWLYENVELNSFANSMHTSMLISCDKAIKKLIAKAEKFDLIISDPPSFFGDGRKRENSLNFYKKHLLQIIDLLSAQGHLVIFLNTHSITRQKFKRVIGDLLRGNRIVKIIRELNLDQDCPRLPHFPEGDYLKGLVLKRK